MFGKNSLMVEETKVVILADNSYEVATLVMTIVAVGLFVIALFT